MTFADIISKVNDFVWGPVMLVLLVGTGIFLMIRLRFKPIRNLGYALRQVFSRHSLGKGDNADAGDISPFQSLMTALAATIGTGNIVGVATAMTLGGPGALFWMWISALFGLATKYGESVLAVFYREKNQNGEMSGGPMFSIKNGFTIKWLGTILAGAFAVFAVIASFGIGNLTQINSIADAVKNTFSIPTWITGLVIAVLVGIVLLGGIQSIGKVSSKIVPVMAVFYGVGCLIIIIINAGNMSAGLSQIMESAFSPNSILGGVAGFSFATAMRFGVARGVFSNEAGLGSAPIAAAAAKTDHPSRQGYINMTGTFFDTIIVCTLTGLAIACSGALGTLDANGELVTGASLTITAFTNTLGPVGGYVVTVGLILFAFSTILGWSYYGEKSLEYLARSPKARVVYRCIFAAVIFIGAITTLEIVWDFSDTANGLMAIPNLICLLVLSNVIVKQTNDFDEKFLKREKLMRKQKKHHI
ncbi:alanine/glycine:cation symporter family protein [Christensenella hongkongensis]|uniref:alanine/glycine:cation symporter family protein n=1 Tax=Christensenella hongkongensis TaxID=270498 RepID=UPI002672E339|nr:sodium:alanine symporter family protein [Christensenella hongkongensis]